VREAHTCSGSGSGEKEAGDGKMSASRRILSEEMDEVEEGVERNVADCCASQMREQCTSVSICATHASQAVLPFSVLSVNRHRKCVGLQAANGAQILPHQIIADN
jgi:hypothetical protein